MPRAVRRWLGQVVTSEPAGDDVEQRGLARAVRPDDRLSVAREDLQAHVLHRVQSAEALRQAAQLENRLCIRLLHAHSPFTTSRET